MTQLLQGSSWTDMQVSCRTQKRGSVCTDGSVSRPGKLRWWALVVKVASWLGASGCLAGPSSPGVPRAELDVVHYEPGIFALHHAEETAMADPISRRHFTTLSTGLVLGSATTAALGEEKAAPA